MRYESPSRKVFNACNIFLMLLMMAVVLFPYLNVLAKAFNDGNDTALGGITIYPRMFTMQNFQTVVMDDAFGKAFVTSVSVVVAGTLLALLVQFMAAYAFLHRDLFGHRFLMVFLMIPMYFGGGLIPTYILYSKIGMLNNYLVYVLPCCFNLYNMIIIRSYLATIPFSLNEAAKLDGANDLKVFFRIILPLSKPILATIALWTAVGLWSDWTTTLYFITKKDMYTLQYVLVQVLKETEKIQNLIKDAQMHGQTVHFLEQHVTTDAVRSAQIIVTTLPIVVVYPFLQKYFIQGVTLGAVKD